MNECEVALAIRYRRARRNYHLLLDHRRKQEQRRSPSQTRGQLRRQRQLKQSNNAVLESALLALCLPGSIILFTAGTPLWLQLLILFDFMGFIALCLQNKRLQQLLR